MSEYDELAAAEFHRLLAKYRAENPIDLHGIINRMEREAVARATVKQIIANAGGQRHE